MKKNQNHFSGEGSGCFSLTAFYLLMIICQIAGRVLKQVTYFMLLEGLAYSCHFDRPSVILLSEAYF